MMHEIIHAYQVTQGELILATTDPSSYDFCDEKQAYTLQYIWDYGIGYFNNQQMYDQEIDNLINSNYNFSTTLP